MFVSVGKSKLARRECWYCLALFVLALTIGCGGGKARSAKHSDVSGKVTYKGQPVTGGRVVFFNESGFMGEGVIDESGNYTVNAPVGNVKIMVDNKMLQMGQREAAKMGAGPRPGAEPPKPIKGSYVRIPDKYAQPDKTDMSYTVKDGQQTFDIDLKD